jgi:hypothetical protein
MDEEKTGAEDEDKIVRLRPGGDGARTYERTMTNNSRRYSQDGCPHKGPYLIDRKLATVECQDCGALLNPMYVLEQLCYRETYWNQRQKDLSEYLAKLNDEIRDRERTKCTHCGNMTAIRFKAQMPRTWVPRPYD